MGYLIEMDGQKIIVIMSQRFWEVVGENVGIRLTRIEATNLAQKILEMAELIEEEGNDDDDQGKHTETDQEEGTDCEGTCKGVRDDIRHRPKIPWGFAEGGEGDGGFDRRRISKKIQGSEMNNLKLSEIGGRRVTLVREFIAGSGNVWIATDGDGQWGVGLTVAEAVTELHENPMPAKSSVLPAASGLNN